MYKTVGVTYEHEEGSRYLSYMIKYEPEVYVMIYHGNLHYLKKTLSADKCQDFAQLLPC